jgi:endonuclease-3
MKKSDAIKFVEILKETYPDATCSLDFKTPFQMVVAVMLSAQCTDERVNKTTPALFERCKTIQDFTNIDLKELEEIIHPCGFYKNKAKNIKLCAKQVLEKFNGVVPDNMDDLQSLAGVGRKSANVVMLEAFNNPQGIAVDTHAKRISNLIGLSNESDPVKIEQDLIKIFPKEYLKDINHLFVWHGRNTCIARKPKCDLCSVKEFCKHYKNSNSIKI